MTDVITGTSIYIRHNTDQAALLAKRCKAMKLSWVAIGAVWQDSAQATRFLNIPARCQEIARAMHDVGIIPYVWGYPWLGAEQFFIDRMVDCAGDDGLHLLDPELGMNPSRDPHAMVLPNQSAQLLVSGLRAKGAKRIGLSTFGGIPSWFPLRAFLRAGVDFAGGQTYSEDSTIDTSIASFLAEMKLCGSTAQLVPNYGLYARNPDGSARSKTPMELRAHLDEFINEGEPVHAMIGWASNFLTKDMEPVLAEFAERLSHH